MMTNDADSHNPFQREILTIAQVTMQSSLLYCYQVYKGFICCWLLMQRYEKAHHLFACSSLFSFLFLQGSVVYSEWRQKSPWIKISVANMGNTQ